MGRGGRGVLAALLAVCLLTGANARALQADGGSLLDQVKSACPRYSFYGEDFLMGVNLLNVTNTQSVGECCTSCSGDCFRWSWCPTTSAGGCTASAGPLNGTLFSPGACLHSNNNGLNNTMLITYSKQQPGEAWVSGILAAQGSNPVSFETAAQAQDFSEYMSSANGSWYLCRQVAGGSLQLSPLFDTSPTSFNLTQGQQVNYTGIQLDDGSGNAWAVVLAGPGPDPYMYPAADLAFCPQGEAGNHPQCTANLFGRATEEGASCTTSSDCCSSLVCQPRAVRDLILLWPSYAGTDQSKNFTVSPGQAWSPLPNECVRQYDNLAGAATVIVSTWTADNTTVECSSLNLTALQNKDSDIWARNTSSSWTAPEGSLLVDDGGVQAYRDELCASLDTANATLASDVAAGGADAQKAYLAMFAGDPDGGPYTCPGGPRLAQIFVDYASGGGATVASLTQLAQQLVDAAASAGNAACVNVAVVTADSSKVVQTYEIHTPPGSSSAGMLPNGTVRLSGSQSCTQGVPDVIMAGSWGAVCSWGEGGDAVHQRNAQVVCRGQGLPSNQPTVTTETSPGVYVWIKDLNCTGSESSIMDCPYTLGDGTAAGSQDCLQMSITCIDSASADAAVSAMCTERPGRCQKLPGSCDPAQGYCAFEPQPAGTPCLGGVCDAGGQCASAAS